MPDQRLRGDNRNDTMAQAVARDPEIATALEARRQERLESAICDAIQSSDDRKLAGCVTVAVWEDEQGRLSHSIIGDGHSSFLELKGYLHDGVWAAAHSEP